MKVATVLLAITVATQLACAESHEYIGAELMDHCGYSDCVKLENETTRVVLGPHCGGRVLEYSLNGKNAIYINPKQNGWVYDASKEGIDPSGGRLDIGPETTIPKHPDLWLGKWQAEIVGPRRARMTSVEDKATGTQLIREFTLDESSSKLTVTQTIKNISDEMKHWCHWSRTLATGHGICIIPLTPNSKFPNKYIMYESGSAINYRPKDANIRVGDDHLEILSTPKNPKLGIDSYAGWFCYLGTNDVMLVKKFPTYPDRVYNEIAGITISIWYYKDIMCELEPIGPMENIASGESVSYTEQWWLIPHEFPSERNDIRSADIATIVAEKAK